MDLGVARALNAVLQDRLTRRKKVHDQCVDIGLHELPFGVLGLGDGDEVRTIEDAFDTVDLEERACERGRHCRATIKELCGATLRHDRDTGDKLDRVCIRGYLGLDEHCASLIPQESGRSSPSVIHDMRPQQGRDRGSRTHAKTRGRNWTEGPPN